MSIITIKDLNESMDLDRKAMLAIAGGARRGGYSIPIETRQVSELKLVNFPAGFGRIPASSGKLRK